MTSVVVGEDRQRERERAAERVLLVEELGRLAARPAPGTARRARARPRRRPWRAGRQRRAAGHDVDRARAARPARPAHARHAADRREPARVALARRGRPRSPAPASDEIGRRRSGGNSVRSASSTIARATARAAARDASTPVNLIRRNGSPSTISSNAVAAAIGAGPAHDDQRESRYHEPALHVRGVAVHAACQRRGRARSRAGRARRAAPAARVSDDEAAIERHERRRRRPSSRGSAAGRRAARRARPPP